MGCYLLSEVSAEPPTVYRIVSPAHMGKIIVSQKSRICQIPRLDKFAPSVIIKTERSADKRLTLIMELYA